MNLFYTLFESIMEEGQGKLPHDVFYVDGIEVIRNPTSTDYRQMSDEVRKEFPKMPRGDISTRFTQDARGNRWIWKAHEGTHFSMEPLIQAREGVAVNQNA